MRDDSEPVDDDRASTFLKLFSTTLTTSQAASFKRSRPSGYSAQNSKQFRGLISMLHAQISQHRNGNIFHNPIKISEAPDYHDIVKRPMDLKTIKAHIKDNAINTSTLFQRDIYLMFMNAMMYNRPHSDIYKMAEEVGTHNYVLFL